MPVTRWLVCDKHEQGDGTQFCLFTEATAAKLSDDVTRCPRHGCLIGAAGYQFDGKTRKEVRAALLAAASREIV